MQRVLGVVGLAYNMLAISGGVLVAYLAGSPGRGFLVGSCAVVVGMLALGVISALAKRRPVDGRDDLGEAYKPN